jgi:hypothetical protein
MHDLEKWRLRYGKDHARSKSWSVIASDHALRGNRARFARHVSNESLTAVVVRSRLRVLRADRASVFDPSRMGQVARAKSLAQTEEVQCPRATWAAMIAAAAFGPRRSGAFTDGASGAAYRAASVRHGPHWPLPAMTSRHTRAKIFLFAPYRISQLSHFPLGHRILREP